MTETGICSAITKGGGRCKGIAKAGSSFCYAHDPDRAEERRANARKGGKTGGRGRPSGEMGDLRREIRAVVLGVLSGRVERGIGATVFMGYNTLLRAVEVERRVHEQDVVEARLNELEARLKRAKAEDDYRDGRGYGY